MITIIVHEGKLVSVNEDTVPVFVPAEPEDYTIVERPDTGA